MSLHKFSETHVLQMIDYAGGREGSSLHKFSEHHVRDTAIIVEIECIESNMQSQTPWNFFYKQLHNTGLTGFGYH
jgi:hypothetical protein